MIFLILVMLASPLCAEPLSENQSRFGVITGDVGLLTQGADDWIVPHEGLPLEPGDHIRTGDDGIVELAMSDIALWVLEPHTEVVIEHTETSTGRLDLAEGQLLGTLDSSRAVGTVQHWEFNTPAAVMVVHGTEFGMTASRQEGARLGVFSGKVDLQPAETAEGPQPTSEIPAMHEAVARRSQPIQILSKYSVTIAALNAKRPELRKRQKIIEDTWSPFTPTVRKEMRDRFVSKPAKHRPVRKVPARTRHPPPASS